ncbi:hypothetical protein ACJZ2D_011811 [Fusarium nematophilum]
MRKALLITYTITPHAKNKVCSQVLKSSDEEEGSSDDEHKEPRAKRVEEKREILKTKGVYFEWVVYDGGHWVENSTLISHKMASLLDREALLAVSATPLLKSPLLLWLRLPVFVIRVTISVGEENAIDTDSFYNPDSWAPRQALYRRGHVAAGATPSGRVHLFHPRGAVSSSSATSSAFREAERQHGRLFYCLFCTDGCATIDGDAVPTPRHYYQGQDARWYDARWDEGGAGNDKPDMNSWTVEPQPDKNTKTSICVSKQIQETPSCADEDIGRPTRGVLGRKKGGMTSPAAGVRETNSITLRDQTGGLLWYYFRFRESGKFRFPVDTSTWW